MKTKSSRLATMAVTSLLNLFFWDQGRYYKLYDDLCGEQKCADLVLIVFIELRVRGITAGLMF